MLSDVEIFHLQKAITFHRNKQAEEIGARDAAIASLQLETKSLSSVIGKHQDQYAMVKEKLVKALVEFEMRGVLLESEKTKNSSMAAALERAENNVVLAREEKNFVRKQLSEAENLLAQSSLHRNRAQELETLLLHSREQIRVVTDAKSSLDSLLSASVRDLEGSKLSAVSLEMKVEVTNKEKLYLNESISELRQQLAKAGIISAEELSEIRRELLRARDLAEAERLHRIKSESAGEAQRMKEFEDRRLIMEKEYREKMAQKPATTNEKEERLSAQLEALRKELEGRESQRAAERAQEGERVRALDLYAAKLQLQLDASKRTILEVEGKYDAVRAEGRYARQQVLEVVGFAMDIVNIAATDQTPPADQKQKGRVIENSPARAMDKNRVQGPLLMLSPRAKAALKEGGYAPPVSSCPTPQRLFAEEGEYSKQQVTAHDPFDLPILYGLSDALCLPDLRSMLQILRDRVERVVAHSRETVQVPVPSPTQAVKMQKSISQLEVAEKMIRILKSNVEDLDSTIARLESEKEAIRVRGVERDMEIHTLRTEVKVIPSTQPETNFDSERGPLLAEISLLKSQVATLISQNKDVNAYFSLVVPVMPTNESQGTVSTDNTQSDVLAAALVAERARSARLTAELEQAHLTIASLTPQLLGATDNSQLDIARQTIDRLTAQLLAASGLSSQLAEANTTILILSAQLTAARAAQVPETVPVGPSEGGELLALRKELLWSKRHHSIMRRAVLLLERKLKSQCDESIAAQSLSDVTIAELEKRLNGLHSKKKVEAPIKSPSLRQSREEDSHSIALQALEKLKTRSEVWGRIVAMYRECLFALKDRRMPLTDTSVDRDEVLRGFESDDGEAEGAATRIQDPLAVYDHDRDYSIHSLSLEEGEGRGAVWASGGGGPGEGEEVQGPQVCLWLDREVAAVRGTYEGEVRTLEEIISALRALLRVTEKTKRKKRRKSIVKEVPSLWSQDDDFVVRHVDKEKIRMVTPR